MMVNDGRRPPDIVVILSDEHAAAASGFAGHDTVLTPGLDELSRTGVTFDSAYCNSPMCVPSRLSLMTGQQVETVEAWDNSIALDGHDTWGDHLRRAGYRSTLVGRTHFNRPNTLLGFDDRLSDDLDGWLSSDDRPPTRTKEWRRGSNSHVSETGSGDHPNTTHDESTTELALDFLHRRADETDRPPFLLYVGYMHPHFPLVAPPEFRELYDAEGVQLPGTWSESVAEQHPVIAQLRYAFRNDEPLAEEAAREATASYWALVTHLDDQIGQVLEAIKSTSLDENTVIIYSSDHGEMAGHHGIWQKQCFYEPSVRVPLLLQLPEHRAGTVPAARVTTDVSLIDVLPTLRDLAQLPKDDQLPGHSLLDIDHAADRSILSQYHAQGMLTGGFMLKHGSYKYCAYAGHDAQLFDVVNDPDEIVDLIGDPAYAIVAEEMAGRLTELVDVDATDARARADQRRRLDA